MRVSYFDHASSTPVRPRVLEAMSSCSVDVFANPSSAHFLGLEAKAVLNDARGRIASVFGADPNEILFTSGGTESTVNSLIGAAVGNRHRGNHLLTTAFEHNSVLAVFEFLREEMGFETETAGVDSEGMIRLDELEKKIRKDTVLLSAMAVNNEIGTIQDLVSIARICSQRGVLFHSDCVAAIGKIPVDFHRIGVDLASVSGHKFGGPKGIGFMYIKKGTFLRPLCRSSHEFGLRAGTVNVPGAAGLAVAAEEAAKGMTELTSRLTDFRNQLREHIVSVAPEAKFAGNERNTVPAILNVRFPGLTGEQLVLLLSRAGISASAGSACQSGKSEPSHVITAMGVDFLEALSTLRLSMGWSTTQAEIDHFKEVFPDVYRRARSAA